MVGLEFIIAIAAALFFISVIMDNFTALPAQLAVFILMFLCVLISLIIFWSTENRDLRSVILGLLMFLIVELLSGAFLYVLPEVGGNISIINNPVVSQGAMIMMPLAYIPLIYAMLMVAKPWHTSGRSLVTRIIELTFGVSIVGALSFFALVSLYDHGMLYISFIYGAAIVGDTIVIGLCAMLILAGVYNVNKYAYGIILVAFVLSLAGDILAASGCFGFLVASNLTQLIYSITVTFMAVTLLFYSMGSVNRMLLDRVNRELYDTRRLVSDLLLYSPDAMCVTSSDGTVIKASNQFSTIIGITSGELIGNFNLFRDYRLIGGDIGDQVNLLKSGNTTVSNSIGIGDRGRRYRVKMFPTYSESGEISSYVIVVEDVTEVEQAFNDLKDAQNALKLANDDLESRVTRRTLELAELNQALTKEVDERKLAEGKIRASLAENEVLLKEVHHRVKNNLQVITSLLSIQSSVIKDSEGRKIFRESQNRIQSMALVHETLYQSNELASIDFGRYVDILFRNLYFSYYSEPDQAQLILNTSGVKIDVNRAIPCGLIINELLSIALGYSDASTAIREIYVGLHKNDIGLLELEVRNPWVASCANILDSTSISYTLIELLTDQLEGSISIDRRNGLSCIISFNA